MKIIQSKLFLFLVISSSILANGCKDNNGYGIFESLDENTVTMDGVIDSNTPRHWDNYITDFPNTNLLIMQDCPGSTDDESNVEVAKEVRNHGLTIHLPSNAEIASGAVDFFLAGIERTRDAGSKIGVHSWADGNNNTATDYPVGHEEHDLYIDYYKEMGFSQEDAEAFYYFTINAASHDDMHWMTDEEISLYKLLTP